VYRLAKRLWFSDFGVYRGHDHSTTAAPGLLRGATTPDRREAMMIPATPA
jgi:hypothetical protein